MHPHLAASAAHIALPSSTTGYWLAGTKTTLTSTRIRTNTTTTAVAIGGPNSCEPRDLRAEPAQRAHGPRLHIETGPRMAAGPTNPSAPRLPACDPLLSCCLGHPHLERYCRQQAQERAGGRVRHPSIHLRQGAQARAARGRVGCWQQLRGAALLVPHKCYTRACGKGAEFALATVCAAPRTCVATLLNTSRRDASVEGSSSGCWAASMSAMPAVGAAVAQALGMRDARLCRCSALGAARARAPEAGLVWLAQRLLWTSLALCISKLRFTAIPCTTLERARSGEATFE